jgi:flagellar biosynthetic protein FliR
MDSLGAALSGEVVTLSSRLVIGVFIVFCRVGACLMVSPGFSSQQIPVQVRLFAALGLALSVAPMALGGVETARFDDAPVAVLQAVARESLIGGAMGLFGRLVFAGLETLAVAMATMLGMANPFGIEVEPGEVLPPLASLITLSATALIFVTDLHWETLRGLVDSYTVLPIGTPFDPQFILRHIGDVISEAFRIALRVSSPFVIYAIIVNVAISIVNRLSPQIAIYFIATPFVILGGLLLLYVSIGPMLEAFMRSFSAILTAG